MAEPIKGNQSNHPVVTIQRDALLIKTFRHGETHLKIIPLSKILASAKRGAK
jgi:hypothetical protein